MPDPTIRRGELGSFGAFGHWVRSARSDIGFVRAVDWVRSPKRWVRWVALRLRGEPRFELPKNGRGPSGEAVKISKDIHSLARRACIFRGGDGSKYEPEAQASECLHKLGE